MGMIAVQSCQKEYLYYQGEEDNKSGIYFYSVATFTPNGTPLSFRDSVISTFQNDIITATEKIVELPVRTLGHISDKDREFKVKVVGGTAQEGIDFEKLKDSYILPAGSANARIPIKIYRRPILLEKALTIDFQLVENDNFSLKLPFLLNIGNNTTMDATKFRINYSEIITEPSYYKTFGGSFFGPFTVTKYKILNDLMGWLVSDWRNAGISGTPVQYGKFTYAANLFKDYLEKKLKEGNPVYDEDGNPMQLGTAYMVDYSSL